MMALRHIFVIPYCYASHPFGRTRSRECMGLKYGLISVAWLCLLATAVQAQPYVAGGAQWKPYAFEDENGHLEGISVEIARRVMQLASLDVTFITYPVNRLNSMLDRREIDVNFADALIWNTAQEQAHYVFSKPYSAVSEHLYFLANHPDRARTIAQMGHLKIGMIRGYTYATLEPALASKQLSKLETSQQDSLVKLLSNGRVDAIAVGDDIFDTVMRSNHLDTGLFYKGAKLGDAPLVFKLQPEHANWLPLINSAIDTLRINGEIDRIRNHYLPAP